MDGDEFSKADSGEGRGGEEYPLAIEKPRKPEASQVEKLLAEQAAKIWRDEPNVVQGPPYSKAESLWRDAPMKVIPKETPVPITEFYEVDPSNKDEIVSAVLRGYPVVIPDSRQPSGHRMMSPAELRAEFPDAFDEQSPKAAEPQVEKLRQMSNTNAVKNLLAEGMAATYGESRLHIPRKLSPADQESIDFHQPKTIHLKGGPLDGGYDDYLTTDSDGHLYFFRNNHGEIEQCVYRIVLKEKEREKLSDAATDDERAAYRKKWAGVEPEWDWVGEYVGKRRVIKREVNGIRKGS